MVQHNDKVQVLLVEQLNGPARVEIFADEQNAEDAEWSLLVDIYSGRLDSDTYTLDELRAIYQADHANGTIPNHTMYTIAPSLVQKWS